MRLDKLATVALGTAFRPKVGGMSCGRITLRRLYRAKLGNLGSTRLLTAVFQTGPTIASVQVCEKGYGRSHETRVP